MRHFFKAELWGKIKTTFAMALPEFSSKEKLLCKYKLPSNVGCPMCVDASAMCKSVGSLFTFLNGVLQDCAG